MVVVLIRRLAFRRVIVRHIFDLLPTKRFYRAYKLNTILEYSARRFATAK